ncbi:TauD/TfdA family dioxygenase [Streptomyces sp. RKAG290]|uniref:TauD/TfdA family dioxygenase n=1 Tax=Streptomyces sp. RKAG290 TaxID=2888348 RepID=UPI0035A8B3DC
MSDRESLPFHSDGCDALGLLCLRAARSGAQNALVSSAAVHNAVMERRPDLVERLYRTISSISGRSRPPVTSRTRRSRSRPGAGAGSACATTAAISNPRSASRTFPS